VLHAFGKKAQSRIAVENLERKKGRPMAERVP
jgi:hypothetical protein